MIGTNGGRFPSKIVLGRAVYYDPSGPSMV